YNRALTEDERASLYEAVDPFHSFEVNLLPQADQSGVATITVTVEDGGLDNDLSTDFEFSLGAEYAGDDLRDILTVDLDHDGDLDLVSASYTTDRLSVRLNDGSGQFGNAVYYDSLDPASGGIATADFNGDGHTDLVLAGERQSGKIVLHPGNGTGGFGDRYEYAFETTGGRPLGIIAQDLTGDGVPDVALVDNYRDKLFILPYNRTAGTFSNFQEITTGHHPDQTAVTDIDRDGDYDLVVGCTNGGGVGSIQVFTNNGTGTFTLDHEVAEISTPNALVVGDINNDGHDDVITSAVIIDKLVYVLLNDGNGTITKSQTLPLASDTNHNQLDLIDYNRDGWLDLAIVEGESSKLKIYQNTEGFFSLTSELTPGLLPVSVHQADIDGDGDPDLIVGHKATDQHHDASNTIRVVENHWEQANATTIRTFEVTVNPVNDVPTLDPIADVTLEEDAPEQTVDLTGITAGGGETQPLRGTATSSNTDLIPDPTVVLMQPPIELARFSETELGMHNSWSGDFIASKQHTGDGNVRLWQLQPDNTLQHVRDISSPDTTQSASFGMTIILDDNFLGIGSHLTSVDSTHDGRFYTYNRQTGTQIAQHNPDPHTAQYFG
ncbi:MAG: VCBS repeat-containing protein, partial [Pseudomonadales bacterium]|nr:VCBS repeat-containing protein [Pseudomonadales bacterium]